MTRWRYFLSLQGNMDAPMWRGLLATVTMTVGIVAAFILWLGLMAAAFRADTVVGVAAVLASIAAGGFIATIGRPR